MNTKSIIALLLLILPFLAGCGSFRPSADRNTAVVLTLAARPDPEERISPAPLTLVTLPAYLQNSTIYVIEANGSLRPISGYYWAEPLSNAVTTELSLALSGFPLPDTITSIRTRFYRFALMTDGSANAIVEMTGSGRAGEPTYAGAFPVTVKEAWDPDRPESFLEGYRALLQAVADTAKETLPRKTKK